MAAREALEMYQTLEEMGLTPANIESKAAEISDSDIKRALEETLVQHAKDKGMKKTREFSQLSRRAENLLGDYPAVMEEAVEEALHSGTPLKTRGIEVVDGRVVAKSWKDLEIAWSVYLREREKDPVYVASRKRIRELVKEYFREENENDYKYVQFDETEKEKRKEDARKELIELVAKQKVKPPIFEHDGSRISLDEMIDVHSDSFDDAYNFYGATIFFGRKFDSADLERLRLALNTQTQETVNEYRRMTVKYTPPEKGKDSKQLKSEVSELKKERDTVKCMLDISKGVGDLNVRKQKQAAGKMKQRLEGIEETLYRKEREMNEALREEAGPKLEDVISKIPYNYIVRDEDGSAIGLYNLPENAKEIYVINRSPDGTIMIGNAVFDDYAKGEFLDKNGQVHKRDGWMKDGEHAIYSSIVKKLERKEDALKVLIEREEKWGKDASKYKSELRKVTADLKELNEKMYGRIKWFDSEGSAIDLGHPSPLAYLENYRQAIGKPVLAIKDGKHYVFNKNGANRFGRLVSEMLRNHDGMRADYEGVLEFPNITNASALAGQLNIVGRAWEGSYGSLFGRTPLVSYLSLGTPALLEDQRALTNLQKIMAALAFFGALYGTVATIGFDKISNIWNNSPEVKFTAKTPTRTLKYIAPTGYYGEDQRKQNVGDLIVLESACTDDRTPPERLKYQWLVDYNQTGKFVELNNTINHIGRFPVSGENVGNAIKLIVTDEGGKQNSYTMVMPFDRAYWPQFSPRPSVIPIRGICYNIGIKQWTTFPSPSKEQIEEELYVSKNELGCNAIRLYGNDIDTMIQAAHIANKYNFTVIGLNPRFIDATIEETKQSFNSFISKMGNLTRNERVLLVVGCELTLDSRGWSNATEYDERAKNSEARRQNQDKLNELLRTLRAYIPGDFAGQATYARGTWEEVDWKNLNFNIISSDEYWWNSDTTYVSKLKELKGYGKPFYVIEFGVCPYEDALGKAGSGYLDFKDKKYDETAQANYIRRYLELFDRADVDGYFLFHLTDKKIDPRSSPRLIENSRRRLAFYAAKRPYKLIN